MSHYDRQLYPNLQVQIELVNNAYEAYNARMENSHADLSQYKRSPSPIEARIVEIEDETERINEQNKILEKEIQALEDPRRFMQTFCV